MGCCQEHVSGLPLTVIFTKTNNGTVIFYIFCGRIPWQLPVLVGWVYGAVVLCPGAPQGSTGSGSDSKASQKTGPLVYKTLVYPLHHGGFILLKSHSLGIVMCHYNT